MPLVAVDNPDEKKEEVEAEAEEPCSRDSPQPITILFPEEEQEQHPEDSSSVHLMENEKVSSPDDV